MNKHEFSKTGLKKLRTNSLFYRWDWIDYLFWLVMVVVSVAGFVNTLYDAEGTAFLSKLSFAGPVIFSVGRMILDTWKNGKPLLISIFNMLGYGFFVTIPLLTVAVIMHAFPFYNRIIQTAQKNYHNFHYYHGEGFGTIIAGYLFGISVVAMSFALFFMIGIVLPYYFFYRNEELNKANNWEEYEETLTLDEKDEDETEENKPEQ